MWGAKDLAKFVGLKKSSEVYRDMCICEDGWYDADAVENIIASPPQTGPGCYPCADNQFALMGSCHDCGLNCAACTGGWSSCTQCTNDVDFTLTYMYRSKSIEGYECPPNDWNSDWTNIYYGDYDEFGNYYGAYYTDGQGPWCGREGQFLHVHSKWYWDWEAEEYYQWSHCKDLKPNCETWNDNGKCTSCAAGFAERPHSHSHEHTHFSCECEHAVDDEIFDKIDNARDVCYVSDPKKFVWWDYEGELRVL